MDKTKPIIIVISGYARAGKTTTCEIIKESFHIETYSSSRGLHEFTKILIVTITGAIPDQINTYIKETVDWVFTFNSGNSVTFSKRYKEIRQLLIDIAEKALVKVFGRDIFAFYLSKKVKENWKQGKSVCVETVGGEEFQLFLSQLSNEQRVNIVPLNIRRHTERPGIDLRQHISGGIDIHNEGTVEELALLLKNKINHYCEGEVIVTE